MEAAPTLYDLVPYESSPISATSPEHLSLTSWLHGGPRPPTDTFRFLEIGCGDGTNLLPLAFYHPGATFIGVDASVVQIERGREAAAQLGLSNLKLETADVRALGDLGRPFDYIVSHGVFSWVPEPVRQRILACCREQLAPEGLAYISYNVYPGWKLRGMVREVLLSAVRGVADPRERARRAKEAAAELRAMVGGANRPYPALLDQELGFVIDSGLPYVLHEYLSEENVPVYFREFVGLAREHGLDHVTDALLREPDDHVPDSLRAQAKERGLSDVEVQQTVDILHNRQFRASVLCRTDTPRRPRPGPEVVRQLHVAACLTGASGKVRLDAGVEETFRGGDEAEITAVDPVLKAALWVLREMWPAGLGSSDLIDRAVEILRERGIQDAAREEQVARLEKGLVMLYRKGLADFRLGAPPLRVSPGLRPALTALARHEVERRTTLTSPVHVSVPLDDLERRIASRLDGTRTLGELVPEIVRGVASGDPPLKLGGLPLTDALVIEPMVRELVTRAAVKLAAWGLLAEPAAEASGAP